jgi:riboflavin kinase / FMN adenylyltransferase
VKIIGPGNIQTESKHSVLTVGTFDGLHLGHKHVLALQGNIAGQNGNAPKTIITFSNHPRSVLYPEQKAELLSTLDEKLELFEKEGIDFVYMIEFTHEFSTLSPQKFIEYHIIPFQPKCLVIGREHFFGRNKEGNPEVLKQFGELYGFDVEEAEEFTLTEINVSSTVIRSLLRDGNTEEAKKLLGYNYFFSGKVIQGERIGSELGYPTANIMLHDRKLIPASGVYAAYATIDGTTFPGMLYIGTRPTFDNKELNIEMNIFNFTENLYNQIIKIEPVKYIREDQKFSGRAELIEKIKTDEMIVRQILKL